MKFTMGNTQYTTNEKGNRFYKIEDGKKTRISEVEFNEAFEELGHSVLQEKEIEETLERIKEEKPKKKRRSKDIAFELQIKGETAVTLTAKQVDFLHHVPDTCFFEGAESGVWVDVLCDDIGGQFQDKPMTVGAMVSTLREKNIVTVGIERVNGHKAKFFEFTELGKTVLRDLDIIREV